jgi:2-polyprenyl-3-methyl-5-hydroxy-6-metoxy-1,4-benzoquinol methylase
MYKEVTRCRVCGNSELVPYLDLGNLPLANNLVLIGEEAKKYPLKIAYCSECYLSQLTVVVDPKVLYKNYPYRSSVSVTFQKHCYELCEKLNIMHYEKKWGDLNDFDIPQPTLIDIGANDGCLMHQSKRHGIKPVLGVEPDKTLHHHVDKDIPMSYTFWPDQVTGLLSPLVSFPKVDFITAMNVFAHCDDIHGFLKGVQFMLKDDGVFVVEVPHLVSMINNTEFDTIYHEHLSYFLLSNIKRAVEKSGMFVFKVEQLNIHGGSIRVYICKDNRLIDSSVEEVLSIEKDFLSPDIYKMFASRVSEIKEKLVEVLKGKDFIGYGASAKGSTLLNYCGVKPLCIIDDTPSKWGKFIPGVDVAVVDYQFALVSSIPYILLLAWNFKDEIITKNRNAGYKGKWVIPIPEVEIL